MNQAQLPYVLLYLCSTFLSSVSQVLLKKAALREHKSVLAEYTDWRVILGYGLFVGCTLLTMLAYYRSAVFDAPRRRWMRPAAMVLCMSITLSTMLLKQHSVIDVVFGLLLALALDYGATVLQSEDVGHRRLPERL